MTQRDTTHKNTYTHDTERQLIRTLIHMTQRDTNHKNTYTHDTERHNS